MTSTRDLLKRLTPPSIAKSDLPQVLHRRYAVEQIIGSGGMAVVMMATDLQTKQRVAVKMLHPHLAQNMDAVRRFGLEARAVRDVCHRNVVSYLDQGTDKFVPFIVMELVQGPTLADVIKNYQGVPAAMALDIARQCAEGLEAMHAHGIVHRDVKPANILLETKDDKLVNVKVGDLGFVRVRGRRITQFGSAVGTSSYMAPEQVVAEQVDARCDVYGLGVTLFIALTSELPFDGSPGRVMGLHLSEPAPPASWLREELDPSVDRILESALRKAPENRYPTMRALREDIERIQDGTPARGAPLRVDPDVYEPKSALGRNVLAALDDQYG